MARKAKNKLAAAVTPSTASAPVMGKVDKAAEMRYRAQDALRDLERAEEHKRNPELMKHVKGMAKEKQKNLDKICK